MYEFLLLPLQMFNSSILHDYATPVPGLDFENIYDDLVGLSSQPLPEPTEGTALSDTTSFDHELHPSLAEFGNEHYVELSDIGFVGEWTSEFVAPGDYHCPLANDSSYGLGNIYPDYAVDPYMVSESQLTGFADDQFPSTFEVCSDPAHTRTLQSSVLSLVMLKFSSVKLSLWSIVLTGPPPALKKKGETREAKLHFPSVMLKKSSM